MDITKIFEIQCRSKVDDTIFFTIDTKTVSEYDYQSVFENTIEARYDTLKDIPNETIEFMMHIQTPSTQTWVRSDRLYLMYIEYMMYKH